MEHTKALPMRVPRTERESTLREFVALLLRWNARINLVAETTMDSIWHRHILDSLQLAPLLPEDESPIADLGSGAGLPGMVLAIVDARPVHLIEADQRKAAFLTEAAARLRIGNVHIHAQRIEATTMPPLGAVTARALAPLRRLLPYAAQHLAPGGVAIFPKGRTAEAEMAAAGNSWTMTVERFASNTDALATIFRLSEIRRDPGVA